MIVAPGPQRPVLDHLHLILIMKIVFAGFSLFIAALTTASFGMQDPTILLSGRTIF